MKSKKKGKRRNTRSKKESGRTAQEIAASVGREFSEMRSHLDHRDFDTKLGNFVKDLVALGDVGTKESAARLLYLAMDLTTWVSARVDAKDPIIFELAKTVPLWPVIVYPGTKAITIPPGLGSEYEALDLQKLNSRRSKPREVAWRLLRIVDLTKKLLDARNHAMKLARQTNEFAATIQDFGEPLQTMFLPRMKCEVERWNEEASNLEGRLTAAISRFAQYLQADNVFANPVSLEEHVVQYAGLPDSKHRKAVDAWWRAAKYVFLTLTKDEPQCCKVLDGIAEPKIDGYERTHGKGAQGAQRYRAAGIVFEVQKAFRAIFRDYRETNGESLRSDSATPS